MILVPLLNPKFATVPVAKSCELRVRGTRAGSDQVELERAPDCACGGIFHGDRCPSRIRSGTGIFAGGCFGAARRQPVTTRLTAFGPLPFLSGSTSKVMRWP